MALKEDFRRLDDIPLVVTDCFIIAQTTNGQFYIRDVPKSAFLREEFKPFPSLSPSESPWKRFYGRNSVVIGMDQSDRAYVFGENEFGQLGLGDTENRPDPQLLVSPNGSKWVDFVFGKDRVIGRTDNEQVYVWGCNRGGALGIGGRKKQTTPQLLPPPPNEIWKEFFCGWHHTYATTQSGKVFAWGWNEHGNLGLGHRKQRKHVWGWVKRKIPKHEQEPELIDTPLDFKNQTKPKLFSPPPNESTWKFFTCGLNFTIGMTHAGDVYVWGDNEFGELGLGDVKSKFRRDFKILPPPNSNTTWKDFVCAKSSVFGITEDGQLFAWGENKNGLLDSNFDAPGKIFTPQPFLEPNRQQSTSQDTKVIVVEDSDDTTSSTGGDRVATWANIVFGGTNTAVGVTNFGHLYVWGLQIDSFRTKPQLLPCPLKIFSWQTSIKTAVLKIQTNLLGALNGEYADLKIGTHRFHSALVALRCPSLLKFAVQVDSQEQSEGTTDIPSSPLYSGTVSMLLNLIYGSSERLTSLPVAELLQLYQVICADQVASRDFQSRIFKIITNLMDERDCLFEILQIAEELKLEDVLDASMNFRPVLLPEDINEQEANQALDRLTNTLKHRIIFHSHGLEFTKRRKTTIEQETERTLADYLRILLETGQGSDFTIVLHGERIPVHRFILSERNGFFKAMVGSQFVESKTRQVDLSEYGISISSMKKMIEYIYCGEIKSAITKEESNEIRSCKFLEM